MAAPHVRWLAVLVLAVPVCAHAQPWSFTRIADWNTFVPGSSAPFRIFNLPSIRDGHVGFAGFSDTMGGPSGVYSGSGGALSTIADSGTAIPGGTGSFTGFAMAEGSWPSMSGSATAFIGDGFGTSFIQRGIYLREGGALTRVVDRATPMPNGGGANFFNIWNPSLENGRVAFAGWALDNGQRGVYSWENGTLSVIADKSTPIPGGSGTFTNIFDCALDQGRLAFSALGSSGQSGLYLADQGFGITRIYDTNTSIPGGGGSFTFLGRVAPSDGRIAFYGQGPGQEGFYADVGGQLAVVADHDTPAPGLPGVVFSGFGDIALDHGILAFQASLSNGDIGVFSTHTGLLQRVIGSGDPLDGRTVEFAFFGGQGLDGNSIATYVYFTNGTRGIYMAAIPAPAPVALLALAGLWAAPRRRR